MSGRIVIVGAGMAGIACARALADAGREPLILDKGRGIGGRMATRRVDLPGGAVRFDHGAQYFTVRDEDFAAALARVPDAVGTWEVEPGREVRVGLPGMSGLVRALAAGLTVRHGVEVAALRADGTRWTLEAGGARIEADHVVLTVPAPQAAALLGPEHPLSPTIASVRIAPCLTLMAAFPPGSPRPFAGRASDTHPLAWIAQDGAKPGRGGEAVTWVAQAGPDWSAAHLEEERERMAARMLPLLCEVIGTDPAEALHVAAHRWRHARVTEPVGRPFLQDAGGTLHLGGDWCLAARVEAAWQSGTAIARDIIAGRDAR